MKRTIIDNVTMSCELTRLAAAVVQNANYDEKCAAEAELRAQDVSNKIMQAIRIVEEVIRRQHEVHDNH